MVGMSRRRVAAVGGALALALLTAACGPAGGTGEQPYRHGRLTVATGNTTGVYYQLGGGYADLISAHLPGYEATAEATGASLENLRRVADGDCDIAFTLADAAADAVTGTGSFDSRQPVQALARIYTNYTHVIVRREAGIGSVADLAGARVSTGSPGSGTENVALRLLSAAGLDPEQDVDRRALSLPQTVAAMREGALDALFWSGGLPTGGISDLFAAVGDQVAFLPIADLLPELQERYGEVYQSIVLPGETYGADGDVPTIGTPNLIVVSEDLPDQLAHDLARLLVERQAELALVHPEGRQINPQDAPATGEVPLHPGAQRYYDTGAGRR